MQKVKRRFKKQIYILKDFYKEIASKKSFYIPVLLFIIFSFAYSTLNMTISIDDLARDQYYGSGHRMILGYRWGQIIWNRVFSSMSFNPIMDDLIGICFLYLSSVLVCSLIHYCDENRNVWTYTIFASIFCTYPLINELWEYTTCGLIVYGSFCLSVLALLYLIVEDDNSIVDYIIAGLLVTPAMTSYESVVAMYILLVFVYLYLVSSEHRNYPWLKEGFTMSIPLFIALFIRIVVGYMIISFLGLSFHNNGDTEINYLTKSLIDCLKDIVNNAWYYGVRGLTYLPIGEFVIALFVFVSITIKKQLNGEKKMVLGLLLLVSIFTLSIVQGARLKYRTAQTVQLFVSFVAYLFLADSRKHKNALLTFLLCISFIQSIYLNQLLSLNHQRSEDEIKIARTIGNTISSSFDSSKKVLFVGEYQLGEEIEDKITINPYSLGGKIENRLRKLTGHTESLYYDEFVLSNVNSVLNWNTHAFEGQSMMKNYFSYLGYEINTVDDFSELSIYDGDEEKLLKHYVEIAKELDMEPYQIIDIGEFLLVYLGEPAENINR